MNKVSNAYKQITLCTFSSSSGDGGLSPFTLLNAASLRPEGGPTKPPPAPAVPWAGEVPAGWAEAGLPAVLLPWAGVEVGWAVFGRS